MKITFIGSGNIGGATAIGLVACGAVSANDVTVTGRTPEKLERFKSMGMTATTDNVKAVKGSDIVFFAVKPWQMEEVVKQCAPALDLSRQLIVSIAPGIKGEQLIEWLGGKDAKPSIAYVIPNTAMEVGQSMTFIAPVTASSKQCKSLKALFDKCGTAMIVKKNLMLAGTSAASCGIAYAMRYISAAMKGSMELGFGEDEARQIVCQTVKGAEELIKLHNANPETEIDKVTTPGGLTLRGLSAMEKGGFSEAVIDGLLVINAPKKHRLVIKVGSNVLTRENGSLDTTRVSAIVDQIAKLRTRGYEIILVSSGAVACGRSVIKEDRKLSDVQQRQLFSSMGQVRLMDLYFRLFSGYGINVGQVLTMKKNFSEGKEFQNQQSCMETMLQSGVLPIVNENDTVSITELMFTDNDELSGLVAHMMNAETMIILSNIDGIYTGHPDDPASKVIRKVEFGEDLSSYIDAHLSTSGRGGMTSKYSVAGQAAAEGIRVIIANGTRSNILTDVLERPEKTIHTEFIPRK